MKMCIIFTNMCAHVFTVLQPLNYLISLRNAINESKEMEKSAEREEMRSGLKMYWQLEQEHQ